MKYTLNFAGIFSALNLTVSCRRYCVISDTTFKVRYFKYFWLKRNAVKYFTLETQRCRTTYVEILDLFFREKKPKSGVGSYKCIIAFRYKLTPTD